MADEHKIPEIFKDEDIIYHYCKFDTAMLYILLKGELKLSPRHKSVDPIESTKPFHYHSSNNPLVSLTFEERKKRELFREQYNKNIKQLCFCKNSNKKNNEIQIPPPLEHYGFMKPRMWDQYADKYKGVCLAFSKKELEKQTDIDFVISKEVDYVKYNILELNHPSINDDLEFDVYCQNEIKRIQNIIFRKHIDYIGENEYRFCSFSKKEDVYIDISNCLKGIVISETNTSLHFDEEINRFAENYKAELLYIKWNENGIKINTKKEKNDLHIAVKEAFERINNQIR